MVERRSPLDRATRQLRSAQCGAAAPDFSINGVPPERKTIEDTIDVPIYGRVRLVADNPGLWRMHCHVLPHAEGGMMTLLRVQ